MPSGAGKGMVFLQVDTTNDCQKRPRNDELDRNLIHRFALIESKRSENLCMKR